MNDMPHKDGPTDDVVESGQKKKKKGVTSVMGSPAMNDTHTDGPTDDVVESEQNKKGVTSVIGLYKIGLTRGQNARGRNKRGVSGQ